VRSADMGWHAAKTKENLGGEGEENSNEEKRKGARTIAARVLARKGQREKKRHLKHKQDPLN